MTGITLSSDFDRIREALVDRYAVEREIGRGGMATVYLARDLKHDRWVAIKVLAPHLTREIGAERFLREIRLTAKLQHPHILPVYDSGERDGLLYFVMPYIEGESLSKWLSRTQRLAVDDALRVAREVAGGLAYAHEQGIVHRDIKPANILIAGGHAVIADFGIAKAAAEASDDPLDTLTKEGSYLGTPAYGSPEQAYGKRDLDGRTDIYSLSCVLYEMTTGRRPFTGPAQDILAQHVRDKPTSVRAIRREIPTALARLIARGMEKDPDDRVQTAAEFAAAIDEVTSGEARRSNTRIPFAVATYLAAGLLILPAADGLSERLLLPRWFPVVVLVVLVIGLPLFLATAFYQFRVRWRPRSVRSRAAQRLFTWRNAFALSGLFFALLGVVAAGYVATRALGIGPAASLVASGVLQTQENIIVAEFESVTGDSALAQAATEALRVDLAQSPIVTVVDAPILASALERMQTEPRARLSRSLASELAIREGIKAIVAGEMNAAGRGYVLTAELVQASTGRVLSSHRETARDTNDVIGTIDRLSRRLRGRIGESLRSIRNDAPLERVTTASLNALRKYTQAVRAIQLEGNPDKGVALLEETVAVDPEFAMAWRKLGVEKLRLGLPTSEWAEPLKRAFDSRDRLTERERYLTIATYHSFVTRDQTEAVRAFQNMLDLDPDDYYALDNLADIYARREDYERAEPLRVRAVEVYPSYLFYRSLISTQVALGKFEEAEATLESYEATYPNHPDPVERRALLAAARGDYDEAEKWIRSRRDRFRGRPGMRAVTSLQLAQLAALRGRLAEDESHLRDYAIALEEAGRADAALQEALLLSNRDRWIRRDPSRAIRRIEAVLDRIPLARLPLEDRPYLHLAERYALAGRTDRARELIAAFQREIAPDIREGFDAVMHQVLAHIATGEGRYDEAIAQNLRWEGGQCLARCSDLAIAYDMAGRADSAVAIYERYVTSPRIGIPPPHRWGPFLERLAQLYDDRGDRAKAAEYYTKFVSLWAEADEELQPRVRAARARLDELADEGAEATRG